MDEIAKTVSSFSRNFIRMPQCWLQDCIDFFKHQEDTAANYTQDDVDQFVYMQWLLFDIRNTNIPVLPANIIEEKKYELTKTITLQLLSVIDISRSKYSQIQKIRYKLEKPLESDVKEFEYKEHSKRCLQLTLTDGVQKVQAFEYKFISNLSLNLKPGMKIRFIAPLTIRYGQIMLENESNILLLGGEVEEILVSNAAENILAAALNLPINEKAIAIENIQENAVSTHIAIDSKLIIKQADTKNNFLNKISSAKVCINSQPSNKAKTTSEDEEFDMLMEIENELHGGQNTNSVQINKPKTGRLKSSANIFDQSFEEDIDYMLDLEDEIKNEQFTIGVNISTNNIVSIQNKTQSSNATKDLKTSKKATDIKHSAQGNTMDSSFGISADLTSKLSKRNEKLSTSEDIADIIQKYKPFKSAPEVFDMLSSPDESPKKRTRPNTEPSIIPVSSTSRHFIKETNELEKIPPISKETPTKYKSVGEKQISPVKCMSLITLSKTQITSGKFKVNAKFKKVIDKLTLKEEKWYIKLQIEDSSGTLDVTVDYELVDKLIGYTYKELKVFAQKGGQQFKEALDTFKVKLQSLDGVLEISFTNKQPKLTNIL